MARVCVARVCVHGGHVCVRVCVLGVAWRACVRAWRVCELGVCSLTPTHPPTAPLPRRNDAWVEAGDDDESYLYALLGATLGAFGGAIALAGLSYHWFAPGTHDCSFNISIVTVALLLCVVLIWVAASELMEVRHPAAVQRRPPPTRRSSRLADRQRTSRAPVRGGASLSLSLSKKSTASRSL